MDDWIFRSDAANDRLLKHFGTTTLKGFGINGMEYAIIAAGAILYYLDITQHERIGHITAISRIEEEKYVWLDRFTIRNLELFNSPFEGAKTLIDIIDRTSSPMGGRLLKKWIALPLKDREPVVERHIAVECLVDDKQYREDMVRIISGVGDLERLVSKIATGRINPREVVQLKRALRTIDPLKEQCEKKGCIPLKKISARLDPCPELVEKIENTVNEDPPAAINKGNIICEGVSEELDELRNILHSGKDYLVQMQERESKRTGIPSLKVGFNNVFGYYIEVRNTHKSKVPEEWIRKQTLVSAERYITEELKEYENKILGAEEKILVLEQQLYNDLIEFLVAFMSRIQVNAGRVAELDCLASFAGVSVDYEYTRPEIDDSHIIDIKNGRHPVIEQQLPAEESYIPNDVYLDNEEQQVIILTGPNMSGKSALLRQTALIVLLAQAGCFVPASGAKIGIVDKIFTRVGASDNISVGESTFMVEMNEAASILNNISDRSLILLDEIGRGTSTYDGISIAWAIV